MLAGTPVSEIRENNMASRRKILPDTPAEPPAALDAIDRKILALLQEDN